MIEKKDLNCTKINFIQEMFFEIVKLIKMLMIQDSSKQLCSTDKEFLNKAQKFALSELAAAQCKSYTMVLEEMKKHILNSKNTN